MTMMISDLFQRKPDTNLSLEALRQVCSEMKRLTTTEIVAPGDTYIEHHPDDLRLTQLEKAPFNSKAMSGWAFRQLCTLSGIPVKYAFKLNNRMAALNLNWLLPRRTSGDMKLIITGGKIRGITSTKYKHVWNDDLLNQSSLSIPGFNVLYSRINERVCSVTLVEEKTTLVEDEELSRGLRISNSEVGAGAVHIDLFWYRWLCSNGLIMGKRGITSDRIAHVGKDVFSRVNDALDMVLTNLYNSNEDIQAMRTAMRYRIDTRSPALIKRLSNIGLTAKETTAAVSKALQEEGECKTAWQLAQGVTAMARDLPNIDRQHRLETIAGKFIRRL